MKHKHYDLIMAWVNGAEIQVREANEKGSWTDVGSPVWASHCEYRIKPKPPVVRYGEISVQGECYLGIIWYSGKAKEGQIKATFCPTTGVLLTIEKSQICAD